MATTDEIVSEVLEKLKEDATHIEDSPIQEDIGNDDFMLVQKSDTTIARVKGSSTKDTNTFKYASVERGANSQSIIFRNEADGNAIGAAHIVPATSEIAGLMTPAQKADIETLKQNTTTLGEGLIATNEKVNKIETVRLWSVYENMNDFTTQGMYVINGTRNHTDDNLPISNTGPISARLFVMTSENGSITQTLMFNNGSVGDGNVYIRTYHDGVWGNWSKLQTNVEVNAIGLGQSKTFDDLTDNNMYSGINVYQVGIDSNGYPITSYETFVLVVLNGYLTGAGVTQLKYSLLIDGTTRVQTRTRQNDVWSEWSNIAGSGGSVEVPMATKDTAGIVKLGTGVRNEEIDYNMPVTSFTDGLGWRLDSSSFVSQSGMLKLKDVADEGNLGSVGGVSLKYGYALGIGTYNFTDVIPLVKGYWEYGYQMGTDYWIKGITTGIPVARNKGLTFTPMGLELDIDSSLDETSSKPVENKAVARSLVDAVEKGRQLALRSLFLAAGAEYNDTDNHIIKDTPWADEVDSAEYKAQWDLDVLTGTVQSLVYNGTTYEYIDDNGTWKIIARVGDKLIWDETKVIHRAGCYYLNGLGDITEEQMTHIYNAGFSRVSAESVHAGKNNIRTNLPSFVSGQEGYGGYRLNSYCGGCNIIEVFLPSPNSNLAKTHGLAIYSNNNISAFTNCYKLRYIQRLNLKGITQVNNFLYNCKELRIFSFKSMVKGTSMQYSPYINKKGLIYTINECTPTTAITLTLHADAYARLANDVDVITALNTKNEALASSGGSINIATA